MKKREIKPALEALKKIRMPKIEDKDVRNKLIKAHLFLLGQFRKFNEAVEDLRTVHLGDYVEKIQEINEKQVQLNSETDEKKRKKLIDEINSYTDVLSAINAFNKDVIDLENEDVDIEKISGSSFVDEYGKMEDYDASVMEALFPMFE